jgi:hypothetical protein
MDVQEDCSYQFNYQNQKRSKKIKLCKSKYFIKKVAFDIMKWKLELDEIITVDGHCIKEKLIED